MYRTKTGFFIRNKKEVDEEDLEHRIGQGEETEEEIYE